MTILVRNALIKDINSSFHNKICDILIFDGIISQIAEKIETNADHVLDFKNLHASPGWVDIFVMGTDPGYEYKDTLESIAASSTKGGFTQVFLTPNTKPVVQNKTGVQYITENNHSYPVKLHPIGAITKNTEGKELTEMYEMQKAGAIAFSDGNKPIQSAGLMIKALQYIKAFKGILIQVPDDHSVAPGGQMNEGIVSTRIGLPGKPALAEDIMVSRIIDLTRYAESQSHITGVTNQTSIHKINEAKKEGINITSSVTPFHLYFSEDDLINYSTNLKVNPPLRTEKERLALINSVKNGEIDCISSHHTPQNKDNKVCEFEYAENGMVSLETTFGTLGALSIPIEAILTTLCFNPRKIFGLVSSIEVGSKADITLFNPDTEFTLAPADIKSKSVNSPFIGKKLKGLVLATILNKKLKIN